MPRRGHNHLVSVSLFEHEGAALPVQSSTMAWPGSSWMEALHLHSGADGQVGEACRWRSPASSAQRNL